MSFTGTWYVVSSPDFDDEYLHMETRAHVTLRQAGNSIDGEYHIGLQTGTLKGRLRDEGHVTFRFEGMDELEPVNGTGTARVEGDRLTFTLMYHPGDAFTFECTQVC
jgi:hypothetical protein